MSNNSASSERLFQVVFDLSRESAVWPPVGSERLWAAKTSVKLHLAVRNVPFYVKGVAYGDIILVRPDNERREIVFERFISESGHSAVQLVIKDPDVRADLERRLSGFPVTWESASGDMYLAVDVRPECDYSVLRSYLIEMQDRGSIGLREAAVSQQHRDQLPSFP